MLAELKTGDNVLTNGGIVGSVIAINEDDTIIVRVKPDGLAIVMEADHFCMHWRGVKDNQSAMTNSVMRGAFLQDANLRREFLSLIDLTA